MLRTIMVALVGALVVFLGVPFETGPAAAAGGTPFQKGFELVGSSEICASFTVPNSQRLIVQYVAGSVIVPTGKQFAGVVSGQTANDVDDIFVPLAFSREVIGPTQDRLRVAQSTLFYVEEGLTLVACFQPLPLSDSFSFFGSLTVTGVLEKN